jgi:prolyl 4-hydroxylase
MTEHSAAFLAATRDLQDGAVGAADEMKRLARGGDPDALMMVGEFHLRGLYGPVDLERGFRMVTAAAEKGQIDAMRARIYLTAMGVGRKAHPKLARSLLATLAKQDRFAAVQLGLLEHVTCVERVAAMEPEIVCAEPRIVLWRGLFSAMECKYLTNVGLPWLERAMIADSTTGKGVLDPVRVSDTTAVPLISEDLIVQEINRAIALATRTQPRWGEPLTVLRYRPGQQYHPHYDAYEEGSPQPQRTTTALVWLNDVYEGGETRFPELGITVRGAVGDMLVFPNLTPAGKRDDRMLHAGLPVTRGEKWLASRWITGVDLIG